MKTAYEAANALEAQMLQDLLKAEGITARIDGAYLQGGIGELPAAGLVRLVVEDDDHARARSVIERWEAAAPAEPAPAASMPRGTSRLTAGMIGLLVGVVASYAFFRSPVHTDGIDHNRDGVLDERWTFSASGTPLKNELDRNLDGRTDAVNLFDARGRLASGRADDDFNGSFESTYRWRNGNIEYSESDTDGDGIADMRSYFDHGVIASTEHLHRHSGKPLRVEHFRLGKLVQAEIDTDADGRLDQRVVFNASLGVERTERLPPDGAAR